VGSSPYSLVRTYSNVQYFLSKVAKLFFRVYAQVDAHRWLIADAGKQPWYGPSYGRSHTKCTGERMGESETDLPTVYCSQQRDGVDAGHAGTPNVPVGCTCTAYFRLSQADARSARRIRTAGRRVIQQCTGGALGLGLRCHDSAPQRAVSYSVWLGNLVVDPCVIRALCSHA
jgi:hypothetical protein